MPGGLETLSVAEPGFDPVQFEPIYTETETKESQPRALFLVERPVIQVSTEAPLDHERRERIQKLKFNRRMGTLLLELNEKKVLTKLLSRSQREEFLQFGFRPQKEPHITVLSYCNGLRIIKALNGDRKKLASVEAEASKVDWSWRPTGEFFSFQGRRRGNLRIMTLIDCPGAEELYGRLEEELPDLRLERDPMHMTLMRRRGEPDRTDAVIGGVALGRPLCMLDELQTAS